MKFENDKSIFDEIETMINISPVCELHAHCKPILRPRKKLFSGEFESLKYPASLFFFLVFVQPMQSADPRETQNKVGMKPLKTESFSVM